MAEPFENNGPGYDQPSYRRRRWLPRSLMIAVACVAIGGFAGVLLYAYNKGKEAGRTSVPPIIKAGPAPHKIRPAKPGGMEVPNRDKDVYARMTGAKPAKRVERLLPPPETPVAPPRAAERRIAEAIIGERGRVARPVPPAGEMKLPPPPPVASLPPRPAREIVGNRAPPPPSKTKRAADRGAPELLKRQGRAVAAIAPAAGGNFRIQIASLRSATAARGAWSRMQKRHRDLLGELTLKIETKTLSGNRGTYHRIQAGPLAGAEAARALCAKLKSRKIGCIVVRR